MKFPLVFRSTLEKVEADRNRLVADKALLLTAIKDGRRTVLREMGGQNDGQASI